MRIASRVSCATNVGHISGKGCISDCGVVSVRLVLIAMQDELSSLLGRQVDLVERSENYIRRRHILSIAETVYVAG